MRRLLGTVLSALRSGGFLSRWSLIATLPLSVTVMAPFGAGAGAPSAWPAAIATWLCFLAGLVLVALLGRRLSGPRGRLLATVAGVLLCAALRPVVQDLWTGASGLPTPPPGQLPFRIATNLLVWAVVFTVVAVLEGSLRALHGTNALLRTVAAELALAKARASAFDERASRAVDEAAAELRTGVDALAPGAAAGVIAKELGATGFRTWSHRLRALAQESDALSETGSIPVGAPADGETADRAVRRMPFRLPAVGAVTMVYGATVLPYALRSMSANDLLIGLLVLLAGGAVIDAAARARMLARRRGSAGAAFLMMSAAMGILLSALAAAGGIPPGIAGVSAVVYLAFAIAAGLCAGALHALRREQRRLSGAIAGAQRAAREDTRPVREGLRRAAELLHRDGQGECTVFGLAHPDPAPADVALLRERLGRTLDALPAAMSAAGEGDAATALETLISTWGRVIDLRSDISPAAQRVLDTAPWAAHDAYDLVAEGLLNAVKHGSERRAEVGIEVVPTGAGPHLRVRVRSFGALPAGAHLRPASHVRDLGARLLPTPGGALLEAALPVPSDSVATAERPAEPLLPQP